MIQPYDSTNSLINYLSSHVGPAHHDGDHICFPMPFTTGTIAGGEGRIYVAISEIVSGVWYLTEAKGNAIASEALAAARNTPGRYEQLVETIVNEGSHWLTIEWQHDALRGIATLRSLSGPDERISLGEAIFQFGATCHAARVAADPLI